jgi:uncharacterized protein YlxP (DUF503 family)
MVVTIGYIHIDLPDVASLKGRRAELNALKERLKKLNLSLLDMSGEYAKEADVAFAFLSHDAREAARYKEKIETLMERYFAHLLYDITYETI